MRALRIHRYGGVEVLSLENIPLPEKKENALLVKIQAASVNPVDWKIRQGLFGLPLPRTLGRDGAGEADGKRVMGIAPTGTHAEYAVFPENHWAPIPDGVSFEAAACLGIAGLSAWIPLVENAKVSAGQRVLIHAGAGGVGCLAIQIAAKRGAEVWTTCSARNGDWCKALGARQALDYNAGDFTQAGAIFDVVLDTVGGAVHRRSAEVLKPGGALVYLNATPPEAPTRKDIRVLPTDVQPTRARLEAILAAGLRVPVEGRYPLERAAEAYEASRGGHVRGKLVILP
jgi:NADPH:quinone reductase-like Zn-dependent oxidoreductase